MTVLGQFSKVYKEVPAHTARKSRWDSTVIWQHPAEKHYDEKTNTLTKEFRQWREKGSRALHPIRYPVGFKYRHKCLFAVPLDATPDQPLEKLDYVESRKAIYLPLFCKLVKKQPQFQELKKRLAKGENLLILEVDGPHQESLSYYRHKYGVGEDFIQDHTILVTKPHMRVMLNDPKHPFGHGYCLAMALLNVDQDAQWLAPSKSSVLPSFF